MTLRKVFMGCEGKKCAYEAPDSAIGRTLGILSFWPGGPSTNGPVTLYLLLSTTQTNSLCRVTTAFSSPFTIFLFQPSFKTLSSCY